MTRRFTDREGAADFERDCRLGERDWVDPRWNDERIRSNLRTQSEQFLRERRSKPRATTESPRGEPHGEH